MITEKNLLTEINFYEIDNNNKLANCSIVFKRPNIKISKIKIPS